MTTNTTTETDVVVMSKTVEGRNGGTKTGDKNVLGEFKLNSKSLFKNFVSTNVCTEIWLDMSHINMKSSE